MTLELGKTIELNGVRLHRYASSIRLTDLANAGKRGKTVEVLSAYAYCKDEETYLNGLGELLLECENFEAMKKAVEASVEGVSGFNSELMTYKGVRVAPSVGDFKPLVLDNESVYVEINWDEYIIRDKKDRNNEPRIMDKKNTDAKKFHKLVSENLEKFSKFNFQDFHSFFVDQYDDETLYKNHKRSPKFIGFHYWCAMD